MQLFYTPGIQPQHDAFVLSEEESKHAVRVLRMTKGDQLHLVDGKGGLYTAAIADAHPKRTVLTISNVSLNYGKRPYYLHIAIAPTKNIDRMEWFLEKATEMGIDEVTPIICAHSERKELKAERLTKVMVAAMKQSLKAFLPTLNEPVPFEAFIAAPFSGKGFIAHCAAGNRHYINGLLQPHEKALVLIGPEGDFSETEIDAASAAGFIPASFGNARLRTETAALTVCLEVAIINR